MHRLHRHLRGLLVALTAIALSAGVALAARPSGIPPASAADGLQRASEAAGKTVPVTVDPPAAQPGQPSGTDEDADQEAKDQEGGDAAEAPDTTDATTQAAERPQNHGWFVSQAAKADTPSGFANHGAYVSSIAKSDAGKPAAATSDRASGHATGATTAAAARAAASAKSHGHSH